MNPLAKYIIPYPTQIVFLPFFVYSLFFPSLFNVQFYLITRPAPYLHSNNPISLTSIVKCADNY